jgi:large repetitive protein
VTATDANGQPGSRAYTVTIAAPELTMTPAAGTLSASYGAPYSQVFTAAGGAGSFSHAITGSLPADLGFSGNTIAGTPTAPGSYPITITATDTVLTGTGAPFSISQNYTIDVPAPTIAVAPTTLPDTTAGLTYLQNLSASGGIEPYSFAVTAGALPNGLLLVSTGALSGTTTSSGTFNFTVTATDNAGQTASRAYSVVVAVPTLTLSPAVLPAGTAGTAYSQTLTIAGGIAPYTVTQTGALPAGLAFDAGTLSISGVATQSGAFNISVSVADSTAGTAARATNDYTLTLAAPLLAITPATLPGATAGTAYAETFGASGGIAPYAFMLASGALPPGLTLAADGVLTGAPTAAGSFSFSVTATDSTSGMAGAVTGNYTLQVAAPSIVLSIDFPTRLFAGGVYNTQLVATGGAAPYRFAVTSGSLPPGLSLGSDGVLSGTPFAGDYSVVITVTDANGFTATITLSFHVGRVSVIPAQGPAGLVGMVLLLMLGGAVALRRARVPAHSLPGATASVRRR